MVKYRKDGSPKVSGGFRSESLEKVRTWPNLEGSKLTRIPESRLPEVRRFLDLLNQYPDRCPLLIFSDEQQLGVQRVISSGQQIIIELLQGALLLPANRGGAIKEKIREALELIQV